MISRYEDVENSANRDSPLLYSDGSAWPSERRRRWWSWEKTLFVTGWLLAVVFLLIAFVAHKNNNDPIPDPNIIRVDILQLNDVYELLPISGRGGISRLAAIREDLQSRNPAGRDGFLTILAGDFFSPSALGLAPVKDAETGEPSPLLGKQMVDVFNRIPVDLATFGNHEFDIPEIDFRSRLRESKFTYIGTTVHPKEDEEPFPMTVDSSFMTRNGVKFAFVSTTTNDNEPSYVRIDSYADSVKALNKLIDQWIKEGKEWDVLVAITHWSLSEDQALAAEVPRIDLIIGGHEHENWYIDRGSGMHPLIIAKADSNVKTVFHHLLSFDTSKAHAKDVPRTGTAFNAPGSLHIGSDLIELGPGSRESTEMNSVIDHWLELAYDAFRDSGVEPSRPMALLPEPIDGMDKYTRNSQSLLGQIVLSAMDYAILGASKQTMAGTPLSILNTGSLRIDDVLHPGVIREYDALRVLPFGGILHHCRLTGRLMAKMLDIGRKNFGNGIYLNYDQERIVYEGDDRWRIDGELVDRLSDDIEQGYDVVLSRYMRITSAEYFTATEKESIFDVSESKINLQVALVNEFKRRYPIPAAHLSLVPAEDERISPLPVPKKYL